MLLHERGDGGRTQQGSVARQHDHGVGVVGIFVGPRGETNADGIAGAALHGLLHEVDGLVGPTLFLDLLGDSLRGVTATTTVRQRAHRQERAVDRHGTPHTGAAVLVVDRIGSLAGGEDYGGQRRRAQTQVLAL